jgi:hypothetical protein
MEIEKTGRYQFIAPSSPIHKTAATRPSIFYKYTADKTPAISPNMRSEPRAPGPTEIASIISARQSGMALQVRLQYLILQLKLHLYARERIGDLIFANSWELRLTLYFLDGSGRRLPGLAKSNSELFLWGEMRAFQEN